MLFNNVQEFLFIISFVLIYNIARRVSSSRALFKGLILVGNFVVLSTVISAYSMMALLVLSLVVFEVGRRLAQAATLQAKNKWLVGIAVSALIFLFCVRNYPWFAGAVSAYRFPFFLESMGLVERIGLSYILFRLIHFLVDAYKGKIGQPGYVVFVNYIFFFPTFLSGPIDRYQNFHYWSNELHRRKHKVLMVAGVSRIFIGVLKKMVIVPEIIGYATSFSLFEADFGAAGGLLASLAFYSA